VYLGNQFEVKQGEGAHHSGGFTALCVKWGGAPVRFQRSGRERRWRVRRGTSRHGGAQGGRAEAGDGSKRAISGEVHLAGDELDVGT
jgi:hypothetical protein